MKRKYAAIALGLTLALSSTAAFAEGTTEAAPTEAAATSEATEASALDANEENTEGFLGQITEITENSIKITNSKLVPVSDTEDPEAANEDTAADTSEDSTDTSENAAADTEDTENTDTADGSTEASTDGAESTGEADDGSLTAVLELSPDQSTTIDYSEATSFKLLTDQYTLTITDNGLTETPADEDTEAPADEDAEAPAGEDTEAPADENAKVPEEDTPEMKPDKQDNAPLIPVDAITEVITADDLQEGDVIYAVLNDDGTAAEITVLAKGDTIAAVYNEADAQ